MRGGEDNMNLRHLIFLLVAALVLSCQALVDEGSFGGKDLEVEVALVPDIGEDLGPDVADVTDVVEVDLVNDTANDETADVVDAIDDTEDALDGEGVEIPCEPQCEGKQCGPDGCGGSCGTCSTLNCPNLFFYPTVQKVVGLAMGSGGHAGEALDIDDDPDTCSPAGDCEGGYNNQLSGLVNQLTAFVSPDDELTKALEDGQIVLLLELAGLAMDGTEFPINMYLGEPEAEKEVCDWQAEKCEYLVLPESFDPDSCAPMVSFTNATVTGGGKMVAGGSGYFIVLSIPIAEGVALSITASMARIEGDLSGEGETMTIDNGLIGGAVRKDQLMAAVDAIPPETMEELPVSQDMIKNLLDMFVQPDVDTDDDGELDAASVGIKFSTIAGTITGATSAVPTHCNDDGVCVPD